MQVFKTNEYDVSTYYVCTNNSNWSVFAYYLPLMYIINYYYTTLFVYILHKYSHHYFCYNIFKHLNH